MSKKGSTGALASFTIDQQSPIPIYKQISRQIRMAVISGRLRSGTRLPATRTLASELGVSRNTIVSVFDDLISEGYIESKLGDGTYVSEALPEDHLLPGHAIVKPEQEVTVGLEALSFRGQGISLNSEVALTSEIILARPFCADLPAVEEFPIDVWSRLMNKCWHAITPITLSHVHPAGFAPLQQTIARHLHAARFVRCTADQLIITSGSQQSLDLCSRLLIDIGDPVWVEEPGYIGARSVFTAAGARLIPVPVDDQGMSVEAGKEMEPRPKLILVSPARQYPLGITMSLERRKALIEFANSIGAWIIEDDYDNEFRYDGLPLPAMQSLLMANRIVYLGTFSKSLLPAFRLGYMVVPKELVRSFVTAKSIITRHAPILEQMTLHEFISTGQFASHIRKMRQIYMARQNALVYHLNERLRHLIEITPAATGMHLTAFFKEPVDDVAFCDAARRRGISLRPLSIYYSRASKRSGLIIGFGSANVPRIIQGVERLANFSKDFLN